MNSLINNTLFIYFVQRKLVVPFPMDSVAGGMLLTVMILTGNIIMGVHQVQIQAPVWTIHQGIGRVSGYRNYARVILPLHNSSFVQSCSRNSMC